MATINVNGQMRTVQSPPDTPLLYVLRNELGVMTPKFGCGLAQCGACSVLLDGEEIRACVTPIEALGLPFDPAVHEAVELDPAGGDTVVAVYAPGYRLGENTLRPAMVKVGPGA